MGGEIVATKLLHIVETYHHPRFKNLPIYKMTSDIM
jgi:hypothetical protein